MNKMPDWVRRDLQKYFANGEGWKAKILSDLWAENTNIFAKP
ncbi:hypothetical protein SFC65_19260 [Priestia filamentosa]